MKTIDFVLDLIGSGLIFGGSRSFASYFMPSTLEQWLKEHQWVEDPNSPCISCKAREELWKGQFSEKICKQNVEQGGSCYRETLRSVFIPFIRNALAGELSPIRELGKVIHKKGPIHDGMGEQTLFGIICHELGGMDRIMGPYFKKNGLSKADREYMEAVRKFLSDRKKSQ